MNKQVANRIQATTECCNIIGTGIATLLAGLIRLPFGLVFGWPDPNQQALERQEMLHLQLKDLEEKSAAERAEAAKG